LEWIELSAQDRFSQTLHRHVQGVLFSPVIGCLIPTMLLNRSTESAAIFSSQTEHEDDGDDGDEV
jgi:hypothetical protein